MNWFKKAILKGKFRGLFEYSQKKAKKRAEKTGLIWHVVFLNNEFIDVESHYFKSTLDKLKNSFYNTHDNKVNFAKIRALFEKICQQTVS